MRVGRGGGRPQFGETVAEEEDAVDQVAVGGALDFKVAEEDVGAEEGEGFVEDVVGFGFGVDCGWVGVRWERGEGVGWSARFGAEREEREVAD